MTDRKTVSVVLSTDAKRRLDRIVDSFDMKQKAALGRILGWFTEQDPIMQSLVLGHITAEYAGDIVDLMYQRRHEGTVPLDGPDSSEKVVDDVERELAEEQDGARTPRQRRRKRA